jgi:hypothetical protein
MRPTFLFRFWWWLGIFFPLAGALAQAPPKEDAEYKRIITEFTQAYAKFPQTKDRNAVLRHMAPELSTELTNYQLDNEIGGGYSDLAGFRAYLDRLASQSDLSVDYKVTKFLYTYERDGLGVAVYEVDYAMKKGGEPILTGREVNTVNFLKKADGWKIVFYSVYDVPTELNRGTCVCEVFQSPGGNVMTKTTFPAGKQYETKLDNFTFALAKDGSRQVRSGSHTLRWQNSRVVVEVADDLGNVADQELGTAQTNVQVVLLALRHVLYAGNCLEIKRK